jgi:diguanylate cyclase (GGDEF)-like protein
MEIKTYWRILKKRWQLLLFGFAVVFVITLILTIRQPAVYETSTTFVIRPRVTEGAVSDDIVRALDIVSRRVEINTTFAEVATSRLIKRQAIDRLELTSEEQQGLNVSARVVGGTNVMEITAEGHDPEVVRDFANAVGVETVSYVSQLYDVYELEPLDEANLPGKPSQPNMLVNLVLGSILGLAFGACLIFLLKYLETASAERESFNIIERETDAYTRSYLLHRLWAEISRARRSKRPLSLGLIRLEMSNEQDPAHPHNHAAVMRLAKTAMERVLREEDVLARFDSDTFAVLLPDTGARQAQNLLNKAVARVRALPQHPNGWKQALEVGASLGMATYEDNRTEPEQFLDEAIKSLGPIETGYSPNESLNATSPNGRNGSSRNHKAPDTISEATIEQDTLGFDE